MDVRKEVSESISRNRVFRHQHQSEETQMLVTNKINNVGQFSGKNVVGKIIKVCSLSLMYIQGHRLIIGFYLKELFLWIIPLDFSNNSQ